MLLYHITPSSNVPGIKERGLIPADNLKRINSCYKNTTRNPDEFKNIFFYTKAGYVWSIASHNWFGWYVQGHQMSVLTIWPSRDYHFQPGDIDVPDFKFIHPHPVCVTPFSIFPRDIIKAQTIENFYQDYFSQSFNGLVLWERIMTWMNEAKSTHGQGYPGSKLNLTISNILQTSEKWGYFAFNWNYAGG